MGTQPVDTSIEAEQAQVALLRAASVPRRLHLARSLTQTVRQLATAGLRRAHPNADQSELALQAVARDYGLTVGTGIRAWVDRIGERAVMSVPSDLYAALVPVLDAFEQLGIAYYIGGSIASSAYGIPRATLDIDLVADLKIEQIASLVMRLQDAYYVSEDAAREAVSARSSFNLIHLATMLKVDVFTPKARPFDEAAFRRIRQEQAEQSSSERTLAFASPEDVLLAKLEWYRMGNELSDRQWSDILGILKVQTGLLDLDYLHATAAQLAVSDLLDRALQQVGLGEG
jgi:hypothetical protein